MTATAQPTQGKGFIMYMTTQRDIPCASMLDGTVSLPPVTFVDGVPSYVDHQADTGKGTTIKARWVDMPADDDIAATIKRLEGLL